MGLEVAGNMADNTGASAGTGVSTWYSKADREYMAAHGGQLPAKAAPLTEEDYKELLELALKEAVEQSPAKDLVGTASVKDLQGKYAGVTTTAADPAAAKAGKYDVSIDWGSSIREKVMDPADGQAYLAQRFSTVFHEVQHVEQKAMTNGDFTMEAYVEQRLDAYSKEHGLPREFMPQELIDRETEQGGLRYKAIVTQSVVNSMYPSMYARSYKTAITEVDADVEGLRGAIEFFDRHPEIKNRYGFNYDKQIMRTDEYDLLENTYQVTKAKPEELLSLMDGYCDQVYESMLAKEGASSLSQTPGRSEQVFLDQIKSGYDFSVEDLNSLSNDERNVILMEGARDVLLDPANQSRIASNIYAYKDHVAVTEDWAMDLYDAKIERAREREAQVEATDGKSVLVASASFESKMKTFGAGVDYYGISSDEYPVLDDWRSFAAVAKVDEGKLAPLPDAAPASEREVRAARLKLLGGGPSPSRDTGMEMC